RERAVHWVGTTEGLYRLDRDRPPSAGRIFERVALPLGGSIRRLLPDRRHRLWIASSDGLAVMTGDRTEIVPLEHADPQERAVTVFALVESKDGAIWAGTQADGLYRIDPTGGRVQHFARGLHGLNFIRDLLEGPDGRIWCTYFGGVTRLAASPERHENPVETVYETGDGIPSADTTDIVADRDGGILAGTVAGVARLTSDAGGGWKVAGRIAMRDGLLSDAVRALAFDPAGSLWLGTIARGAMKIVPAGFRRYPGVEESASILVTLVPVGHDDMLALAAVAAERYRLHRLTAEGSSALDVKLPAGLTYLGWGNPRLSLAREGGYWLATGHGLLWLRDLGRPPERCLGPRDGLPGSDILWIVQDRGGTLWASVADARPGSGTLVRRAPGTRSFSPVTGDGAEPGDLAKSLVEAPDGSVFVGYGSRRVIHVDPRGEAKTLTFDPPLGGLTRLFFDHAGRLWILAEGASYSDDPFASTVRLRPGEPSLRDVQVNCMVEDAAHRLYFGTDRGVFRVDEPQGSARIYTRADGLPGDTVTQCALGNDGGVWFSDPHGVARLIPAGSTRLPSPVARLAALRVDGEAWPIGPLGTARLGPIQLTPGAHRIAAEFFAIDHAPGERISFQHELEGKGGWSTPSDARTLEFPRLGPGRHLLLVRAVRSTQGTADAASVDILIPAPVWQRAWFVTLIVAVLLGSAMVGYRIRVGRLLAFERMRTGIATDLHDAVGADLSRISLLADIALRDVETQPERVRTMLGEVARTARDAVREMSDIVWALQSKPADLGQVLGRVRDYAADVAAPSGIDLQVRAGEPAEGAKLDDGGRRELYLLLKEAVSNAIRHAGARTIEITVDARAGGFVAEVRDDGRGFDPAAPPASRGGRGLGNMRRRAERLGGELTVTSAAGSGTTVRIDVPSA
ncbi:MAG TPA: ATP-binding protein, partial [Candidatus Polarisedimenticolaceae bacterium]|nr:ATP-binding protein [Candidatus Polarisedimenticolaceae bacterium]